MCVTLIILRRFVFALHTFIGRYHGLSGSWPVFCFRFDEAYMRGGLKGFIVEFTRLQAVAHLMGWSKMISPAQSTTCWLALFAGWCFAHALYTSMAMFSGRTSFHYYCTIICWVIHGSFESRCTLGHNAPGPPISARGRSRPTVGLSQLLTATTSLLIATDDQTRNMHSQKFS